jgi:hypothetical protein
MEARVAVSPVRHETDDYAQRRPRPSRVPHNNGVCWFENPSWATGVKKPLLSDARARVCVWCT